MAMQVQMQQAQAQQQAAGGGDPNSQQSEASGVSTGGPAGGGDGGDQGGGGAGDQGGGGGGGDETPVDAKTEHQKTQEATASAGADLTRSIDQAINVLTKSESQLPLSKRKLLAQQRVLVERFRLGLENDAREATKTILALAEKHAKVN
jgi:hypothetical protein